MIRLCSPVSKFRLVQVTKTQSELYMSPAHRSYLLEQYSSHSGLSVSTRVKCTVRHGSSNHSKNYYSRIIEFAAVETCIRGLSIKHDNDQRSKTKGSLSFKQ